MRSENVSFESEIEDEESGATCRLWVEAINRRVAKIGIEFCSRSMVAGTAQFGLVSRSALEKLLESAKEPNVGVVSADLLVDEYDHETDSVVDKTIEILIPVGGRFAMRGFLNKFLPILFSAMDQLPESPVTDDEPVQTMPAPPSARN